MPRRTGNEPNILRIRDHISDSDIVLFYRMPTTREQVAYTNGLIQRRGKKVVYRQGEMRMKYGAAILTGFRTGDFEKQDRDGKWVPYASDPESPRYDPDWKNLICEHAPDLVELLAVHVFESPAEIADDDDGEDPEKNSSTTSTPCARGSVPMLNADNAGKPSGTTSIGPAPDAERTGA